MAWSTYMQKWQGNNQIQVNMLCHIASLFTLMSLEWNYSPEKEAEKGSEAMCQVSWCASQFALQLYWNFFDWKREREVELFIYLCSIIVFCKLLLKIQWPFEGYFFMTHSMVRAADTTAHRPLPTEFNEDLWLLCLTFLIWDAAAVGPAKHKSPNSVFAVWLGSLTQSCPVGSPVSVAMMNWHALF